MAIRLERVRETLRKLRRSLRNPAPAPRPHAVHQLRTRARRVEALAAAWAPDGARQPRRLLDSIRPVRKAAGRVRDMDVLADHLRQLPPSLHGDALQALLHELGKRRKAGARGLQRALARQRAAIRRHLRRYAGQLPKTADTHTAARFEKSVREAAAALTRELRRWPPLTAANLHDFRLKVKELYTLLQLLEDADSGLLEALAGARQQIGLWHDWQQLGEIAAQILDPRKDRALLAAIRQTARRMLPPALAICHQLRSRWLRPERGSQAAHAAKKPAGKKIV